MWTRLGGGSAGKGPANPNDGGGCSQEGAAGAARAHAVGRVEPLAECGGTDPGRVGDRDTDAGTDIEPATQPDPPTTYGQSSFLSYRTCNS